MQSNEDLLVFPFDRGQLPVRYLGLPLLTKRMTVSDFLPLVEKIRTRISTWTGRFLSFGGRLQLIQSVITSLANFWLAVFRLPASCLREIEKLCSAFLWSGPALNTKKAKIAWSEVCRPKDEGGLGIRPLKEMNTVSCLKLVWRILSSKNSLWVKWIHTYLIRKGSFWTVRETLQVGSWMWRKILKYRAKAKGFYKVNVKSGKQTSFWHEAWSDLGYLVERAGERGYMDMGIHKDATVEEVMSTHRRRRHIIPVLNLIEDEIDKCKTMVSREDDVGLWKYKEDKFKRKFSTKQTWSQLRTRGVNCGWSKGIWFTYATPKFALLAWVRIKNILSTGERMQGWGGSVNTSCSLCGDPLETRNHLFFDCRYLAEVWGNLVRGLMGDEFTCDWLEIVALISTNQNTIKSFTLKYVFQVTIHGLWLERNGRRHGEAPQPTTTTIRLIDRGVRNRFLSIQRAWDDRWQDGLQHWFSTRPVS